MGLDSPDTYILYLKSLLETVVRQDKQQAAIILIPDLSKDGAFTSCFCCTVCRANCEDIVLVIDLLL